MPIYEQIPIRLQVKLVSNPPVNPLDANTGLDPKFWRAQSVAFAIGLFDAFDAPIDLSNLVRMQLILQKTEDDLVPLVVKTLENTDPSWRNTITSLGWVTGIEQNMVFKFTPAETDQSLQGAASSSFWLILRGVTGEGDVITYAAGPAIIYNASSALPIGPTNYVSLSEQENSELDTTIVPLSQQHTAVLTISGAARTSNILLANSGVVAGAVMNVLVHLPVTADILLNFKSVLVSNPTMIAVSTNAGVTRALLRFYFDGADWQPLESVLPPY